MNAKEVNLRIFERLLSHYGPGGWWPAKTRFEIIAGAVLTQSVSWKNARQAVESLKKSGMLSAGALAAAETEEIARKIVSSRFYAQKAERLKGLALHIHEKYGGSLDRFFRLETGALRRELLSVRGVGPETADCILLYAAGRLSFVSDLYTSRFLDRYGIMKDGKYEEIRKYFMDNLPEDVRIYNEFHALIVRHGNSVCRAEPLCGDCPVREIGRGLRCKHALKRRMN